MVKSTVDEIRTRFDHDVERFANLETGQTATLDAPLVLDLITEAAAAVTPRADSLLDIGCGAGNYTLKMLERLPGLSCTLADLSQPMLDRAQARVSAVTAGHVTLMQGDIRELEIGTGQFDIILAGMVLHHLRTDSEWESVFRKLYDSLRPGGSLWIADATEHGIPAVQDMMTARYGAYLSSAGGDTYRDTVFAYIEKEDTPRPLLYQIELLQKVGFAQVDVLHRNNRYAAFGGVKR